MPPELGGLCGRLTEDLPLGHLQGGIQGDAGAEEDAPEPEQGAYIQISYATT